MTRRRVPILIATVIAALPFAAAGDEWLPPTTETYYSENHETRLTVTPRDISSPLAYFTDKVNHREPAGQLLGGTARHPQGLLERLDANGHWQQVWFQRLINDVAPVSAAVSNSGYYVVTFDNWHSVGEWENVVVIYGPGGRLIRSLKLSDFLPDYYIHALPRSVSSIYWGGQHRIAASDDRLILSISVPSYADDMEAKVHAEFSIDLKSGRPFASQGAQWSSALVQAWKVAARKEAGEIAWEKYLASPLYGPKSTYERDWHRYLEQAFFRLEPTSDEYPDKQVLRSPSATDYKASEIWLRDALLEKNWRAAVIMIASPSSQENLLRILADIVRSVKPNALRNAKIYVVVTPQYRERIGAALAPTGAKYIPLDPDKPIPPNAEQVRRYHGYSEQKYRDK